MNTVSTQQLLMVLGETQVHRRLAEDALEAAEDALKLTEARIESLIADNERLQSEKGVLLADVHDLERKLNESKGGGS